MTIMAIMVSQEGSLPLYWAILNGFTRKWPLLTLLKGSIMANIVRMEAPGALDNGFLNVCAEQPKGPIRPKVPCYGPFGPSRYSSHACQDRVPGQPPWYRVYVSVAPVGPG